MTTLVIPLLGRVGGSWFQNLALPGAVATTIVSAGANVRGIIVRTGAVLSTGGNVSITWATATRTLFNSSSASWVTMAAVLPVLIPPGLSLDVVPTTVNSAVQISYDLL